jgi:hypothetical protein
MSRPMLAEAADDGLGAEWAGCGRHFGPVRPGGGQIQVVKVVEPPEIVGEAGERYGLSSDSPTKRRNDSRSARASSIAGPDRSYQRCNSNTLNIISGG